MPDETKSKKQFKQDSLVERLVPDPATPSDVITLNGFLGKSSRSDSVRLYLTPRLNDYFDIREVDVVHTQSLETELNPLGGTMIWVKREAELLHTRTETLDIQTEFISGDIVNSVPMTSGIRADLWAQTPFLRAAKTGGVEISCALGVCESKGYCPTKGEATCFRPLCS
jgi:hypothetical protein